jgi:hypothetical protein
LLDNQPPGIARRREKPVSGRPSLDHLPDRSGGGKITEDLNDHLPIEGPGRDDLKQLYSMSLDDASKAQELFDKSKEKNGGAGPLYRWISAMELREWYNVYKEGHKEAVIEALSLCSFKSLPIPRWVELAFLNDCYRKVRHFKAKSWDDVFGSPHEKGTHLKAKEQEREKSILVYQRIEEIRNEEPGTAIDGALFERVGLEFGIGGKTTAETYYYKWKNYINEYK